MEQLSFFAEAGQSKGLPEELLEYMPALFDKAESDYLFDKFIREAPWKQTVQKMYDKQVVTPRLTAWYGDRHGLFLFREDIEPNTLDAGIIDDPAAGGTAGRH